MAHRSKVLPRRQLSTWCRCKKASRWPRHWSDWGLYTGVDLWDALPSKGSCFWDFWSSFATSEVSCEICFHHYWGHKNRSARLTSCCRCKAFSAAPQVGAYVVSLKEVWGEIWWAVDSGRKSGTTFSKVDIAGKDLSQKAWDTQKSPEHNIRETRFPRSEACAESSAKWETLRSNVEVLRPFGPPS